ACPGRRARARTGRAAGAGEPEAPRRCSCSSAGPYARWECAAGLAADVARHTSDMSESTERVVLVTGAGRGLGVEIARQLVDAGHVVVVGARDAEAGAAVAKQLGENAWPLHLDVTDPESVQAA